MRASPLMKALCICAVCAAAAFAQGISEDEIRWGARPYAPQPENAIRVQTNMVEVGVVVRDSHGKTVSGLKQSNFEVYDNGKLQKTTFFSIENAPPPPNRPGGNRRPPRRLHHSG
jgi:hypothetical protein